MPLRVIAFGGLGMAAILIGYFTRFISLLQAFGLSGSQHRIFLYSLIAMILGIALGVATRKTYDLSLLPAGFRILALVAPLIGAMEELIFRGYIQGSLELIGKFFSVISGSISHTSYKLLVILTLTVPLQFDLFFLVFWTFLGGMIFGMMRMISKSTIPPIIAHAVFDLILYGGMATAPVWVWT